MVDLTQKREDHLVFKYPSGQVVYDNDFVVPEYPEARAHLTIRRHDTPFTQDRLPYREGILIKSAPAIHDCTYFGLESEPYAWRFTGELKCDYIDQLVLEYEDREETNPDSPDHPSNNPTRLLDPLRDGLILEHPFAQKLYKKCTEILRPFIDDLKASDAATRRDVTDENLKRKLSDLSKEVSKLFEAKLRELEEEEATVPLDDGEIEKLGVGLHIIPPGEQNIVVSQPKTFSVIVRHYEVLDQSLTVDVTSSEPEVVAARSSPVPLKKFSDDGKVAKTTFTLEGSKVGGEAYIEVHCGVYDNLLHARVIEPPPAPQIPDGLTFERALYEVQINKEKTLLLRLKAKSDLSGQIIAEICSDHPEIVVKGGGKCEMKKSNVPNVWTGVCRIEGRQLKAKGTIMARVRRLQPAQTRVIVGEREPKSGILLKPPIPVPEDFGPSRYKWDHNDPFQLLIGARHPSIRRYLGEPQDSDYPGINDPRYHIVLAEVIAEALAFRILEKDFTRRGQDNRLMDFASTDFWFHRHYSDFLAIAHKCLVTNGEFK